MSAIERAVSFNGKVVMESETVTLAATQQLLGPLRAAGGGAMQTPRRRLGARQRMELVQEPAAQGERERGRERSAAAAAGGGGRFGSAWHSIKGEMKAAELVYGVDCPLPPAPARRDWWRGTTSVEERRRRRCDSSTSREDERMKKRRAPRVDDEIRTERLRIPRRSPRRISFACRVSASLTRRLFSRG